MAGNEAASDLVVVGRVAKPHGIRGELCMDCHAESPLLFKGLKHVWLAEPGKRPLRLELASSRPHQGRVLLILKAIPDRTAAEGLRGMDVLVREADLPELDDDEFYMHEILGFAVEDESGADLGVLDNFLENAEQFTWVIKHPSGREIMLPAVDAFVVDINAEAGRIVVAPPEGLLDIYLKT